CVEEQRQVRRAEALVRELLHPRSDRGPVGAGTVVEERRGGVGRSQPLRTQGGGEGAKRLVCQMLKLVGHERHCVKSAARRLSTFATPSARSRKSLTCSHDVSAISRQPWQAAPCRRRDSCGLAGSCCAHPGSLEQRRPISSAAFRCSAMCLPASTRPP